MPIFLYDRLPMYAHHTSMNRPYAKYTLLPARICAYTIEGAGRSRAQGDRGRREIEGAGRSRAQGDRGRREIEGAGRSRAQGDRGHREIEGAGRSRAQGDRGHRDIEGTGRSRAQGDRGHREIEGQPDFTEPAYCSAMGKHLAKALAFGTQSSLLNNDSYC